MQPNLPILLEGLTRRAAKIILSRNADSAAKMGSCKMRLANLGTFLESLANLSRTLATMFVPPAQIQENIAPLTLS